MVQNIGTLYAGFFEPATDADKWIVENFPWMNNVNPTSMDDTVYFWLQSGKIDPAAVLNYLKNPLKNPPPQVNFKIYQKILIPCGFPKKKGKLTCEEAALNGLCGLKTLLKTDGYKSYLAPNGINEKTPRQRFKSNFAMHQGFKNALQKINDEAFNAELATRKGYLSTLFSLDTFMKIIQKLLPDLLQFLPIECLNVICEASRKVKGKSPVDNWAKSFGKNVFGTTLLLMGQMAENTAKTATLAVERYVKGVSK